MSRGARYIASSVVVLLGSLTTSCTTVNCTLIGGSDGIAVRLDVATAARLTNGHIQLCIDQACSAQEVAAPSTAMVQTCDEGRCADSTVPQVDNTRLFFLIGDPADPTSTSHPEPRRRTVSVKLRSFDREGKASVSGTAQVDLQDTYLNGRDCGVTGRVGNIVVTAAGVSVAA